MNRNLAHFVVMSVVVMAAAIACFPAIGNTYPATANTIVGVYEPKKGFSYLQHSHQTGTSQLMLKFEGAKKSLPIAGDWDGMASTGLYDPKKRHSCFVTGMTAVPRTSCCGIPPPRCDGYRSWEIGMVTASPGRAFTICRKRYSYGFNALTQTKRCQITWRKLLAWHIVGFKFF